MYYYNLVVLQNLTISSAVEGKVFVGGNITSRSPATFGVASPASSQVSLEVAGLFVGEGTTTVNGNLVVSSQNVVTEGKVNNKPVVVNNGVVATDTKLYDRSVKISGDLINFSIKLGSLPATGMCRLASGAVQCKAQANQVNVFQIPTVWFSYTNVTSFSVTYDGSGTAAFIVINVAGGTGAIRWKDKSIGGIDQSRVLFNFMSTNALQVESPFSGGILAPYAHLQAKAAITGSVAVASADFSGGAHVSLPSLVCPGGQTLPPTVIPTLPPSTNPTKAPVMATPQPVMATPQPAMSTPQPVSQIATGAPVKSTTPPPVAQVATPAPVLPSTPSPEVVPA
jgi:choice-of-anchor A domain-containing protein